MSGDCSSIPTSTPQVSQSMPYLARVYPISLMVWRTRPAISTYASVVISPKTITVPVLSAVSQATRPSGSLLSTASSTASLIWSATLSGCPSVTDSEVEKRWRIAGIGANLHLTGSHRAALCVSGLLLSRDRTIVTARWKAWAVTDLSLCEDPLDRVLLPGNYHQPGRRITTRRTE